MKTSHRVVARAAARGLTFIEIIVVLAIVGILFAIAMPSYAEYSTRSKRAEGRAALSDLLQQEERYYAANNKYSGFTTASPGAFRYYAGDNPVGSNYDLSAAACAGGPADACLVMSAAPANGFTDPRCGTLTLSTGGARGPDGCW